MLLYAVEWDTEENAQRYFTIYRQVMEKKGKSFTVKSEAADSVTGSSGDGGFELRRAGAIVTSVEGLPAGVD